MVWPQLAMWGACVRFQSRSEVQSITLRQLVNRWKVPMGPLCSHPLVFSVRALPTSSGLSLPPDTWLYMAEVGMPQTQRQWPQTPLMCFPSWSLLDSLQMELSFTLWHPPLHQDFHFPSSSHIWGRAHFYKSLNPVTLTMALLPWNLANK